MTQARCFHCETDIPEGFVIEARVDERSHAVCCYGCQAAAEFIAGAGLTQFYRHREPMAGAILRPPEAKFSMYENEDVRQQYVTVDDSGIAEATLYIGDLYCPACIWLVDQVVSDLIGVHGVSANPASRRIIVSWAHDEQTLVDILRAIAVVGFKPEPIIPGQAKASEQADYRSAIKRLLIAGVFGMQAMMFAIGLYAGDYYGIGAGQEQLLRVASLLVSLPILLYSAKPFFRAALFSVRHHRLGMDITVSLALLIAFVASAINTALGQGAVYFDSIAMFVFLLCVTRFLEMRARHNADDRAAALASMLPAAVTRLSQDGAPELVAVAKLRSSDLLMLNSGDVIAVDGAIKQGCLVVDESMLTGESGAVVRDVGDGIFAGTRVLEGEAVIEATTIGSGTQLGEIARLIEKAQDDRLAALSLSDRFASAFVMIVLFVSLAALVAWWQIDAERALPVLLSILIVACPCALALAMPTALASAAAMLSRHGLLLVRSRLLEHFRPGATIVFDKTGTLTNGRPELTSTQLSESCEYSVRQCLEIAAAIERDSEHVLARAFAPFNCASVATDESPVTHLGQGVSASVDGVQYKLGKREFVVSSDDDCADLQSTQGKTQVFLSKGQKLLAQFSISDSLRADVEPLMNELRREGIRPVIASGDNRLAVQSVATKLGIDEWHHDQTPQDKLALLKQLKQQSDVVLMVGDGINDAPVLSVADASIAIANGTPLARSTADGILLGQSLLPLYVLSRVSGRTRRVIKQSLLWAVSYNVVAISLAAFGWVTPWMAAIGMSTSSLIVVGNALRISGQSLSHVVTADLPVPAEAYQ